MGTPSYLSFEITPGKYYEQYLQMDGYPSGKGRKYYEAILKVLIDAPSYFVTSNNKPNEKFFLRIKHYLKNVQYDSSHSINNFRVSNTDEEWPTEGIWEYQFNKDGDFIFSPRNLQYLCIIPWKFTLRLSRHFIYADLGYPNFDTMTPFWEYMDKWTGQTTSPPFRLKTYETYAFPGQDENGWRKTGILTIKKNKIKSMFANEQKPRNIQHHKILLQSEYLKVKESPLKRLPLFINSLKNESAISLLERRLKNGK